MGIFARVMAGLAAGHGQRWDDTRPGTESRFVNFTAMPRKNLGLLQTVVMTPIGLEKF